MTIFKRVELQQTSYYSDWQELSSRSPYPLSWYKLMGEIAELEGNKNEWSRYRKWINSLWPVKTKSQKIMKIVFAREGGVYEGHVGHHYQDMQEVGKSICQRQLSSLINQPDASSSSFSLTLKSHSSAISHQPSAISHPQISLISHQPSAISHQKWVPQKVESGQGNPHKWVPEKILLQTRTRPVWVTQMMD